jgi:hypothetical protein
MKDPLQPSVIIHDFVNTGYGGRASRSEASIFAPVDDGDRVYFTCSNDDGDKIGFIDEKTHRSDPDPHCPGARLALTPAAGLSNPRISRTEFARAAALAFVKYPRKIKRVIQADHRGHRFDLFVGGCQ